MVDITLFLNFLHIGKLGILNEHTIILSAIGVKKSGSTNFHANFKI